MPSAFDEMSERAAADYPGGTVEQRRTRALLRRLLEKEGFKVNPDEWWTLTTRTGACIASWMCRFRRSTSASRRARRPGIVI